jgi:hypothetical protein
MKMYKIKGSRNIPVREWKVGKLKLVNFEKRREKNKNNNKTEPAYKSKNKTAKNSHL